MMVSDRHAAYAQDQHRLAGVANAEDSDDGVASESAGPTYTTIQLTLMLGRGDAVTEKGCCPQQTLQDEWMVATQVHPLKMPRLMHQQLLPILTKKSSDPVAVGP